MELVDRDLDAINFEELDVDPLWSNTDLKEDKMHKIHAYPAKFPAFLVAKGVEYAESKNIEVENVGDVFCGCGTTALETKKLGKNFYGWDINPVATLIARVKSESYQVGRLQKYYERILSFIETNEIQMDEYFAKHERINYWFKPKQVNDLYSLSLAIDSTTPKGKYQDFFKCAFSNILKGCSMWLTKSIKPQFDPDKEPNEPFAAFKRQFMYMKKATEEQIDINNQKKSSIKTKNFLLIKKQRECLDLIISSPPYVTSYEYADLHQLSTIWLNFVEDYRSLRQGTIGSVYHENKPSDFSKLNEIGRDTVKKLQIKAKNKVKPVGKYFFDMQRAVEKTYSITNKNGMNIFVIGNTSYKGVKVDNAAYLYRVMENVGFKNLEVYKRKISSKILTPYRDKKGRFSNDSSDQKVYSYEFVLIGQKKE